VFDTLMAAAPALLTRSEIESRLDLVKDEVYEALRALKRRGLLVIQGGERQRTRYGLVASAERPHDTRGQYPRTLTHRHLKTTLRLSALGRVCMLPGHYSAARPPSHAAAPGRARVTHGERCLLADLWRKPK
jgi:hypothetical protein